MAKCPCYSKNHLLALMKAATWSLVGYTQNNMEIRISFVRKKGFKERWKQNETGNKAWESLKCIIYMTETVKKKRRSVSIFSSAMSCPFILLTLSLNVWMLVIFEGQFAVSFMCVCVCMYFLCQNHKTVFT